MPDLIALLQVVSYLDRWVFFLTGLAIGLWVGYVLR
jgi:hypothetical protein